ncbi:MAG TPA: hypothetical protein DCR07_02560 [Lactococcus sp.]|nr:hypothetical protein [Lactococcus sp.]
MNGNPPADLAELLRYMEDTTEKNVCNESIRRLHEMVQHTKQDAKVGLAYMKWYEIENMCREEGRKEGELVVITILRNLVRQNYSVEEISHLTELPCTVIKEIEEQLNSHPEWDNEQVLAGIQSPVIPERLKL